MLTTLNERLKQLRAEYETGQRMLLELEDKQRHLRETLLRISGAIQVLEEALAEENGDDGKGVSSASLLPDAGPAPNPRCDA